MADIKNLSISTIKTYIDNAKSANAPLFNFTVKKLVGGGKKATVDYINMAIRSEADKYIPFKVDLKAFKLEQGFLPFNHPKRQYHTSVNISLSRTATCGKNNEPLGDVMIELAEIAEEEMTSFIAKKGINPKKKNAGVNTPVKKTKKDKETDQDVDLSEEDYTFRIDIPFEKKGGEGILPDGVPLGDKNRYTFFENGVKVPIYVYDNGDKLPFMYRTAHLILRKNSTLIGHVSMQFSNSAQGVWLKYSFMDFIIKIDQTQYGPQYEDEDLEFVKSETVQAPKIVNSSEKDQLAQELAELDDLS
jgi:hypothetical protein